MPLQKNLSYQSPRAPDRVNAAQIPHGVVAGKMLGKLKAAFETVSFLLKGLTLRRPARCVWSPVPRLFFCNKFKPALLRHLPLPHLVALFKRKASEVTFDLTNDEVLHD
jgi:hypothetical protein